MMFMGFFGGKKIKLKVYGEYYRVYKEKFDSLSDAYRYAIESAIERKEGEVIIERVTQHEPYQYFKDLKPIVESVTDVDRILCPDKYERESQITRYDEYRRKFEIPQYIEIKLPN